MTGEERCEHDMIPSGCADCRGMTVSVASFDGSDPLADVLVERFLTARYNGKCAINPDHLIKAGTEVGVLVQDHDGQKPFTRLGYGCAGCVEEVMSRD